MLAVPLVDEGRRDGALNLFADQPDAFTDSSTETAALLAAFATIALSAAHQAQRADQLQQGLTTNREIGAAVGILMATHGISNDDAFALLSNASQRLNRKLHDIATGIVRGETQPLSD
jgi:AmiR/NasT family two-component response regulator